MSIVLYEAPMSSSTPVVMAFAELEVPHEAVTLDLASGDQRKPEFLALNPNGKVPTVVVDGTPMFEALAILQWLGDTFGVRRGLWPARDAPERLVALSWTTWAYVTYVAALQRFSYASSERVPAELHHPPLAARSREELQQLLGLLDARLADRPYLLGDAYSLADLVVGGVIAYGTIVGIAVDDHANVQRWLQRYRERPAYKKVWDAAGM